MLGSCFRDHTLNNKPLDLSGADKVRLEGKPVTQVDLAELNTCLHAERGVFHVHVTVYKNASLACLLMRSVFVMPYF